jgi:hypothetical protein
MPALSFAPEYLRHSLLGTAGICPRKFKHLDDARKLGKTNDLSEKDYIVIGSGLDAGLGCLWAQGWDLTQALEKATQTLLVETQRLASEAQTRVFELVRAGITGYAAHWSLTRWHEIVAVHPYLDAATRLDWLWTPFASGGNLTEPALMMPDLVVRHNGYLTIIDHKTSGKPYNAANWEFSTQLLSYCYVLQAHYPNEAILYQIDYMQRPSRKGDDRWLFAQTEPFVFTVEKAEAVFEWMHERCVAINRARRATSPLRNPDACYSWEPCEFINQCWGAG